jgi:hypothetical protein
MITVSNYTYIEIVAYAFLFCAADYQILQQPVYCRSHGIRFGTVFLCGDAVPH